MRHSVKGVLMSLVALAVAAQSRADVIYVNAAAPAGGDGTSWKSAFNNLQNGIAAATPGSGDQLWVAAGAYKPTNPSGDRAISFNLVSGTAIYGGFNGAETALEQRDTRANLTVLSGDLNGNDIGPANDATHGENSHHVIQANGTSAGTVVDGVVITGGYAQGVGHNDGGGARVMNSIVGFSNCTIKSNFGGWSGGGIFAEASTLILDNCRFNHNILLHSFGGGLSTNNTIRTVIDNCEFTGNTGLSLFQANGGGAAILGGVLEMNRTLFESNFAGNYGGGAYSEATVATVNDCRFINNTAHGYGGGLFNYRLITATNCQFINNHAGTAEEGGGGGVVAIVDPSTFINCLFAGNSASRYAGGLYNGYETSATLINCVFTGNSATYNGGAIAVDSDNTIGELNLINCTLANNTAHISGGGIARLEGDELGDVNLTNCILWSNIGAGMSDEQGQLSDGVSSMNFCCVQGLTGELGGTGNIGDDPMFIDADGPDEALGTVDDNLRLGAGSGSIDMGNIFMAPPHAVDFDGRPRLQACVIDQGAFELQADDPVAPDCNQNLVADVCEIAAHAVQDCNMNFVPDACDIAAQTSADADGNGQPDECQPVPLNNSCGSAAVVPAGATVFTTVHATTDGPTEPDGCGFAGDTQINNDIWFRYPAQCSGIVTVSLCGATFDARLAVYVGCPSQPGTMIACSDNDCGTAPRVSFNNATTTIYRVRIGGSVAASMGGGTMVITCTPNPVCTGDTNGNGTVDITDLLLVINNWGQAGLNPADVNGDSTVNISDLLMVIAAWGPC